MAAAPRAETETSSSPSLASLSGVTRILTCGSVDDGKSTLIGRLLWEIADLPDDQREQVRRASQGRAHPDFSLLVDGLVDERAQGITIDIAWRYFDSRDRRYVLIDSPGNETYTRNMASGASHADLALLLVDARKGLRPQTRRHAAILDLVGVRHVLVAVNKMDLIGWSEEAYAALAAETRAVLARFPFATVHIIPVSALAGDNVVTTGRQSPWYTGPTLVEAMHTIEREIATTIHQANDGQPFRFPVQLVVRDGVDFRGLAGTIRSGRVAIGDEILDPLSGATARVAAIGQMGGNLDAATVGEAVVLRLDRDLDIARGAILSGRSHSIGVARSATLRLVWLHGAPPSDGSFLLRTATDRVPLTRLVLRRRLDLTTLADGAATTCDLNDLVTVDVGLSRAVALDPFDVCRATGSVLLIDRITGSVAAAGVVVATEDQPVAPPTFRLTEDLLRRGLCSDLGTDRPAREELRRRALEVERLFAAAGIAVLSSIPPPSEIG